MAEARTYACDTSQILFDTIYLLCILIVFSVALPHFLPMYIHTHTHIFTYNSFHKYLLSFSSHLYSMIQIIWFQFPFSSLDAIIFSLSVLFTSNISRVNLGHFIQSVQIAYKLSIVSPLGKPVAFTHHVAYCGIFESYHSKLRQNSNII